MLRASYKIPGAMAAPVWFTKLFKFKLKVLEFKGGDFALSPSDPIGYVRPYTGVGDSQPQTEYRPGARVYFDVDNELRDSVITGVRYCNFTSQQVTVLTGLANQISTEYAINGKPYYPTGVNSDNLANPFYAGDYSSAANTNNQVMLNLCDGNQGYIMRNMPVTALSWFNGLATYAPFNAPVNCPLLNADPLHSPAGAYIRSNPAPSGISIANQWNKYNRNKQFCINGIAFENSFIEVANLPALELPGTVGNFYLATLAGTAFYFGFEFIPRLDWNEAVKELGLNEYVIKN